MADTVKQQPSSIPLSADAQSSATPQITKPHAQLQGTIQSTSQKKLEAALDRNWVFNKKRQMYLPKASKRTGFEDKTLVEQIQLVFQLFVVPLSLAAFFWGGFQFYTQQKADRVKTQEQQKIDHANLINQQQEATLQTYLDDMTKLLFDDKLGGKEPSSAEAAVIARSKTIIALSRLPDPQRKAAVMRFLYESHLIGYLSTTDVSIQPPIIDLSGADFSNANLSNFSLEGVNLYGANLSGATLSDADLSDATLTAVYLTHAHLTHATLSYAHLSAAHLTGVDFTEAYLTGADLSDVDLIAANLTGARVTQAQLDTARSLQGATMPDGSKHP